VKRFQKKRKKNEAKHEDQIQGNLHELKGKSKRMPGRSRTTPDLVAKSKNEKLTGTYSKRRSAR